MKSLSYNYQRYPYKAWLILSECFSVDCGEIITGLRGLKNINKIGKYIVIDTVPR
jgi:hypothetical protein